MSLTLPFQFPAAGIPPQIYVQTNFDSLLNYINTTLPSSLTASRAVVTDASGVLASATTTATEIGYVNGVTSAIQTQLNGKSDLALDNLASVAINAALTPGTDNSIALGSASKQWTSAFLSTSLINSATSNQIILGTTRTVTITAPTPAASSRTWTLPDLTTSPTFAALEAAQTFTGAKTFSATLTMSGATIAMGANKITGLANGTAATDAAAFGQIKVLQTVVSTNTTAFTTTSNAYQTTNCSVAITPTSASNRILVWAVGQYGTNAVQTSPVRVSIFRGSTDTDASGNGLAILQTIGAVTGNVILNSTVMSIDSPATTSSTTYAVKIKNDDNATTVRYGAGLTTTIIAMEIV